MGNKYIDNLNWYNRIIFEINECEKANIDFIECKKYIDIDADFNINDLCEIDFKNMTPIFQELGLVFNFKKRKKEIVFEKSILNSKFVIITRDKKTVGYFQYTIFDNYMYVNEMQILKEFRNRSINCEMINIIFKTLKKEKPYKVFALRQYNNKIVEKIHNDFEFQIIKKFNEYDIFLKANTEDIFDKFKQYKRLNLFNGES